MPIPIWRRLLVQLTRIAFSFEDANAGNSSAARIAIMAITTSNSMRVNPSRLSRRDRWWFDACIIAWPACKTIMIRCSMIQFYHFGNLRQRGFFALSFENCALTSKGSPKTFPSFASPIRSARGRSGFLTKQEALLVFEGNLF
jgi:hypothetical protein